MSNGEQPRVVGQSGGEVGSAPSDGTGREGLPVELAFKLRLEE